MEQAWNRRRKRSGTGGGMSGKEEEEVCNRIRKMSGTEG